MRERVSQGFIGRHTWLCWLILCAVIAVTQALTLDIDPLIKQDEVQIVDYGRVVLHPSTEWALTWYAQGAFPVLPLNYPGIVLQELAFELTAPSPLGPRTVALLSALLAATCLLGWLIERGTPRGVALLLAAVFLLDPIYSDLYRGGRIDGWAFAACLASCWLLRQARARLPEGVSAIWPCFWAGVLTALSVFLWVTAPMLFPLVVLEWAGLARILAKSTAGKQAGGWIRPTLFMALGGLAATVMLLVPIATHYQAYLASLESAVDLQRFAAVIKHPIVGLFLVHDPAIFIVAAFAIVVRREWGMLVALAVAIALAWQTAVYLARVVYLIPYGLAIIASASSLPAGSGGWLLTRARNVLAVLLVVLLGFNVYQVGVLRPMAATAKLPANLPNQFLRELKAAVGSGPYRVLLMEWELYYTGRELRWHMYQSSNPIGGDDYTRFIASMDYVILRERPRTGAELDRLDQAGFELVATIPGRDAKAASAGWGIFRTYFPRAVYPTLRVYAKSGQRDGSL